MIAKNSCTILVSLDFLMCVVGPHCGFNLCFPNDAKHLLMPLFFICMGEVEFGLVVSFLLVLFPALELFKDLSRAGGHVSCSKYIHLVLKFL